MSINIKFPELQILNIKKHKYAIVDLNEYENMINKIKEYIEDMEDVKLSREAKATSKKSYTIEEVAKRHNIKLDKIKKK